MKKHKILPFSTSNCVPCDVCDKKLEQQQPAVSVRQWDMRKGTHEIICRDCAMEIYNAAMKAASS